MLEFRPIYEEIMADLCQKGLAGLVKTIDHDYKNEGLQDQHNLPGQKKQLVYTSKTASKNENDIPRPAVGIGGPTPQLIGVT